MELVRKNVHMNSKAQNAVLTITLEDDYNVSDIKPDIEMLLKESAKIENINTKAEEGRALVNAKFVFDVIYISKDKENPLNNISGEIPIKEYVNVDNYNDSDFVNTGLTIEDISIKMINSRKISIKTIVTITITTGNIVTNEVVTDALCDARMLYDDIKVSELSIQKKDNLRIKEEILLPTGKPEIGKIVYKEVTLNQRNIRVIDGGFSFRGELGVFIIYTKDGSSDILWHETTVPFDEVISVSNMDESMLEHIEVMLASYCLEVKPDEDGLERKLSLEAEFDFNIFAYKDEDISLLKDIYEPTKEYLPETEELVFEKVLLKNQSKCQISDSISYRNMGNKLLQLCCVQGNPQVEEARIVDDGIMINGAVSVCAIAVMESDFEPLSIIRGMIPFSHTIQVSDINKSCDYQYHTYLEKINGIISGDKEITIRATVVFDTLVKEKMKKQTISNISCSPVNTEEIMKLPGIVGYIVKDGDTLWDIAKKYKTTVDSILEINKKTNDIIKKGEKLIITKRISNC